MDFFANKTKNQSFPVVKLNSNSHPPFYSCAKWHPPFYSCAKWQSYFKSKGKIMIFFIEDSYESADLKILKKIFWLLNTPTSVMRSDPCECHPKVKIRDPKVKIWDHTWSGIRMSKKRWSESKKRWSETKKLGVRMTEVGVCGRMLNGIFSSNLGGVYLFLCKISREIRKSQRKVDLSTANQCFVHFCQPVPYAILLTWCDQRYCTYQIPLHPPV